MILVSMTSKYDFSTKLDTSDQCPMSTSYRLCKISKTTHRICADGTNKNPKKATAAAKTKISFDSEPS